MIRNDTNHTKRITITKMYNAVSGKGTKTYNWAIKFRSWIVETSSCKRHTFIYQVNEYCVFAQNVFWSLIVDTKSIESNIEYRQRSLLIGITLSIIIHLYWVITRIDIFISIETDSWIPKIPIEMIFLRFELSNILNNSNHCFGLETFKAIK